MKTNKLLVLPLVVVLASCGSRNGNGKDAANKNDAFSKIIKEMNVSQAIKDEVADRYDEFYFVASKYEDMKMYRKLDDGSWSDEPLGISFESTDYYKTSCILDTEDAYCKFVKIHNYGSETPWYSTEFEVDLDENGQFEYVGSHSSIAPLQPKDAYYNIYNSVFAWKTSLLCGATELLGRTDMKVYFAQGVLNVLTSNFIYNKLEDGTFTISSPDPVSYSCKDFQITLHNFCVRYEDYLLAAYNLDFTLEYVAGNKTVDHCTFNVYNVDYSNR